MCNLSSSQQTQVLRMYHVFIENQHRNIEDTIKQKWKIRGIPRLPRRQDCENDSQESSKHPPNIKISLAFYSLYSSNSQ